MSRDAAIKDAEGKSMQAHEVFVHVIAYLKERILNEVRAQNNDINDDCIQYVLTVPAIWSDAAKQLMREAATDPRVINVLIITHFDIYIFSNCILTNMLHNCKRNLR